MTIVHIPPVLDGAGSPLPATCTVRLVNAESVPVIGFVGETLATEYQTRSLTLTGLDLTLAAQSDIALPDGAATWYEVTISTQYRQERYLVQVPDSPSPVPLHTLVGATAIAPADILAGRLLTLDERAALAAASIPSGTNPLATLADIPA